MPSLESMLPPAPRDTAPRRKPASTGRARSPAASAAADARIAALRNEIQRYKWDLIHIRDGIIKRHGLLAYDSECKRVITRAICRAVP